MRETGLGLKAATITPEIKGDVGSPNAILRQEIDGTVIVRTGRRLPGVLPVGGVSAPMSVVRMAVATPTRPKSGARARATTRSPTAPNTSAAAPAAWSPSSPSARPARWARRSSAAPNTPSRPSTRACSRKKWTPPPSATPMSATSRSSLTPPTPCCWPAPSEPLVIPALNRDGDCLSDLVLAFYGSIAGSESILLSFDENFEPKVVMTEAPHGTAPSLQGKNIANPLAMILAGASLLTFLHTPAASRASRAIYEAAFEAIHDGTPHVRPGRRRDHDRVHRHASSTASRARSKSGKRWRAVKRSPTLRNLAAAHSPPTRSPS